MPHPSHTTDSPLISQRHPGAWRDWDSNPGLPAYEAGLLPLQHPAINWRFFSEERLTSKPLAQVGLLFVFRYVSHVLTQLLVVPRSFGTLRILFEPYAARVKGSIKPSPYTLITIILLPVDKWAHPIGALIPTFCVAGLIVKSYSTSRGNW